MKIHTKLAIAIGALALGAAPAIALPTQAPDDPGSTHAPTGTQTHTTPTTPTNPSTLHKPANPGPNASLPAKARAYGKYCKDQSRKRSDAAPGTKGTPFSQCVTAMAKLATGKTNNPRTACREESKKRSDATPGTHGSPYSQCVAAGAKLLRTQHTT